MQTCQDLSCDVWSAASALWPSRVTFMSSVLGSHSEHTATPRVSDQRCRVPLPFQGKSRPGCWFRVHGVGCRQKTFISSVSLFMFLQKPVDSLNIRQTPTETSDPADADQFNSFQFWREPLPLLDTQLLDLLVSWADRRLTTGHQESRPPTEK